MNIVLNKNIVLKFIQLICICFVFLSFIIYFGHPSWEKFMIKGTMIREKIIPNDFGGLPAFAICPIKRNTMFGWKQAIDRT